MIHSRKAPLPASFGSNPAPLVSTGWLALDLALDGGLPPGSIVEVAGPSGSGKTSLGLRLAAAAQQRRGQVAWIDADQSFSPAYAWGCGLNPNGTVVAQPTTLESALDMLERLVDAQACGVVLCDGLDALPCQKGEAQPDWYSDDAYAPLPVSRSLRRMAQRLRSQPGVVIITHSGHSPARRGAQYHQLSQNLERLCLPLHAQTRLRLFSSDSDPQARQKSLLLMKNPHKPYHQKLIFDIILGQGIQRSCEVFDLAVRLGVVNKQRDGYAFQGTLLGATRQTVIESFDCRCHPGSNTLLEAIERVLRQRLLLA